MILPFSRSRRFLLAAVLAYATLGGAGGCVPLPRPAAPPPPRSLTDEVRATLAAERTSSEFFRERPQLEEMGPELDEVLYVLALDPGMDAVVRGNALVLLAEREARFAVGVLRRALLTAEEEGVRASAVSGLQRLAATSPIAARAIRSGIGDPSRRVRLAVLRALDVEDVGVIRALAARESDPEIRAIARQLIGLAEGRGAPLVPDSLGDLRATVPEGDPRIVFHPSRHDTVRDISLGALWVELGRGRGRLRPLAQGVEVVGRVVPAFLSPDSATVVFEAERQIHVRHLRSGEMRLVGPGVAPRIVPFTSWFVYLEERPAQRREVVGGTELVYEVLRARFTGGPPQRLGTLRAVARPERFGNASPARWMVVGEVPEGFALRGEGISTFALPESFTRPREAPRRTP
ncbi:MAG: HEAT repeat domain-containing protein [Gemmatimonadota bacterium]|nr:HEAT repeat domain-containing protein [Gemmatimonadota bacterium]